jgi:WD40 repeat protein
MLVLRSRVSRVDAVAFSPDGARVAVGGTNGIEVWSVHHQERLWRWEDPTGFRLVQELHFGPTGWLLARFETYQHLRLFNAADGQSIEVEFPFSDNTPYAMAVDDTGERIAVSSNGRLSCWRFVASDPRERFPFSREVIWDTATEANAGWPMVFRHAPDEAYPQLWILQHTSWQVRDSRFGDLLFYRRTTPTNPTGLQLSPNGSCIIGRSRDTLVVWPFEALKNPMRLEKENRRQFTGAAFHPSGDYVATTSNDKAVRLWDTTSWRAVRTFEWKAGRMRSIAFAPDGLIAAAGGELGEFVLFDVDI